MLLRRVIMQKKIYYAHSIALYNSKQEARDVETLSLLGFEVVNPNAQEHDVGYKRSGMLYFETLIRDCAALAFRANPDGTINAGVAAEVAYAGRDPALPIIELPSGVYRRTMTVDYTRAYLREQGIR